jgi:ribonuclease R
VSRGGRTGPSFVAEVVGAGRGAGLRPAFEAGPVVALHTRTRGGARIGDLVIARMRGRGAEVLETLGPGRLAATAVAGLLADEGLGRPHPPSALEEAEAMAAEADVADAGRRDRVGERVVTIDPEGAKDHDDAVAARRAGEDVELAVHIADVARFVPAGGAVDREAARRGTSVYLPGTVDPMLPARLSNDVCSLRPGVARKVVTVEMRVGPDGEVHDARFSRSLVRSERRLTYPEVDAYFGGGSLGDPGLEEDLLVLRDVAARLRARRRRRGALEIGGGEPRFRFRDGQVVDVELETQTEAHSLIEECMIAANEAVARYLIARGVPAVFRHHEHPAEVAVERLYEQLEALDVPTPPLPDGPLTPEQAARAARAAAEAVNVLRAGGRAGRALQGLVLRSLRRAYYSPDRVGHSGLASAAYLHFTSPIRRYPDLLVHRSLLDALGLGDPGPDPSWLAEAAETSSERERAAEALERRGDRICLAYLLRERLARGGWEEERGGEVTGIVPSGCFVAFGEAFDGFLPARLIPGDRFFPDPLDTQLIGAATGRRIRLGDPIAVRVLEIEPLRGRVELEPAEAPAPPPMRVVPGRGARPARTGRRPGARPAPRRRGR